jgi:tRNA(Ile)-lysidine synthase
MKNKNTIKQTMKKTSSLSLPTSYFLPPTSKSLLAFSAGIDSTALFFMLLENDVDFDIAIVDYNLREQSKEEVAYAKELAKKYGKKIFIKSVSLQKSNFEANARKVRYEFFEEIIKKEGYSNLLTAHQLDDKLEWFFMQLSKGAGTVELLGFEEKEDREFYTLIRPLLNYTKEELLNYLHTHNIKYFIDSSNHDTKYKRNLFRQKYTKEFLKEYKEGVKRSFNYLQKDKEELLKVDILYHDRKLYILKNQQNDIKNIRAIDKIVKKLGILLSKKSKDELLRQKECVVSHKIAIAITEDKIFIAPYLQTIMTKEFKESCRVTKIPKNIRAYLFNINLSPRSIS